MDVNERAARATQDEDEFEQLLEEYRPFIASCAGKAAGRHLDSHDDEMSIAMIAFSEAVRRYRKESGQFLAFAAHVIQSRVIDYYRKGKHQVDTVSLETYGHGRDYAPQNDASVQFRSEAQRAQDGPDDPLRLEIDVLSQELGKYGFRFMDVAKCSPKAEKTKAACKQAAKCLSANPVLLAELRHNRQLPVQQLEKSTGVSRKTIARHRNYIVCLAEIISGDYAYLAEYVKFDGKGDRK